MGPLYTASLTNYGKSKDRMLCKALRNGLNGDVSDMAKHEWSHDLAGSVSEPVEDVKKGEVLV